MSQIEAKGQMASRAAALSDIDHLAGQSIDRDVNGIAPHDMSIRIRIGVTREKLEDEVVGLLMSNHRL